MCCDAQYWLGAFVSSLSRSRVNAAIEIGDGDSCADADKKEIRVRTKQILVHPGP